MSTKKIILLFAVVWPLSAALALGTYELLATVLDVSIVIALIIEAVVGFGAAFYGAKVVYERYSV